MKYFPYLLATLFIGLKLTHYIDWSWWWILAPIWVVWILSVIAGTIDRVNEIRQEKAKEEYEKRNPPKKSAFMTRLEKAMDQQVKNNN